MNAWLWNAINTVEDINREFDRLMHCSENDSVLQAFPMNPNACTKYRGCEFHDFCMAWANPLQHCHVPPTGYEVKFWDPEAIETTHKKNLEWR
jgi:hypothetical protein